MIEFKIKKLEKNSYVRGSLPKGCKLCSKGAKMVLFVTGICNVHCYYCPLSEKKKERDVIYADEMPVKNDDDIIYEAKSIGALGTGITGGEPLLKLKRVLRYIKILKKKFGEKHHIHLYTIRGHRDEILALESAGLDEIRFHVPPSLWEKFENSKIYERISFALKSKISVGIEIPVIPKMEKQLIHLVNEADRLGVEFINLNELEIPDFYVIEKKNFRYKDSYSLSIKGSEDLAIKLSHLDTKTTLHYCSSAFKDFVQLRKRLIRRAKRTARSYEVITKEGLLILGIIKVEKSRLNETYNFLRKNYKIPKELIAISKERKRIEIAPWILEEIANELPYECYEVEEYPTYDRLQIEAEKLN